jgi:amino acid transporter
MVLTVCQAPTKMSNISTSPEGLVRGIRKWDLVAFTVNAVIGAGIFGLPAKAFSLIGPYSLIAFIACAFVVLLIILCFAEVGSRFDETGGPYAYARAAFGPTVAFGVGWLSLLARLTAFAANCNLMVNYLGFFWPAANNTVPRAVVITLVVLVLAALNVVGVRQAALAGDAFTVGKLLPIFIFVGAGLFFLNPSAFALGARPPTGAFSQSVLLLLYAFTGFEMATIPAGEIQEPQKNLPRALLIATAVVACTYILIQVVCIGTLPELATSTKPLADAGQRFMGTAGGALISAGAIISIAGNLNVLVLSGSRMPFAFAEQRQLPSIFGDVHKKFFTPYISIIVFAAVLLVVTLKSSFVAALTVSAIARLVTYAATCAALPVLRRKTGAPKAVFQLPGGSMIAIAALILSAWLLMHSTPAEAITSIIALAVGFIIFLSYRLYRFVAS